MVENKINEMISYGGAERAILTIIMQNTDYVLRCEELGLKREHFSEKANRYIYSAVAYLLGQGYTKIDSLAIINALDTKGKEAINEFGGMEYLDLILMSDIYSDTLGLYVDKVVNAYKRRNIYSLCEETKERMLDDDINLPVLLNSMQDSLLGMSLSDSDTGKVYKMGDKLADRLNERANAPKDVKGYKVGWNQYDKYTQGYQAGELTVFCAPSKTGKSAILMNHAMSLSVGSGINVLYISTEMTDEEMEERLASCISGVPYTEISNGMFARDTEHGLANDKIKRLVEANELIKKAPFYHIYMPDFTTEKVTALAKQKNLRGECDVLVFDYIKLPPSDVNGLQSAQEYQRLGYMTTCLKDLAGILSIPVISACQSNADESVLNGQKPGQSFIGGSKRILHMASKLFYLVNKSDEELARNGLDRGNQTLWLAFQRSGSSDLPPIDIYNNKPILRMEEA